MHPEKQTKNKKKQNCLNIFFLCTVNIQSIDRGESTYIQFGTHGFFWTNRITFQERERKKRSAFFDRSLDISFKPSENKNKQTKIYKCKIKQHISVKHTSSFFFFLLKRWHHPQVHKGSPAD